MKLLDRSFLHGTFALGLGLAPACGGPRAPTTVVPPPPPPNPLLPRAEGLDLGKLSDEQRAELARAASEFRGVPLSGLGVFELVGLAQGFFWGGSTPVACAPEPCAREVGDLTGRALVVRDQGKIRLAKREEVQARLAPFDSAEKAVLLTAATDSERTVPARCADLAVLGAPCAAEDRDLVPVRQVEGGYEVVLFGTPDVCEEPEHGYARAFLVVRIGLDGALTYLPEHPISHLTAVAARPSASCMPEQGVGRMFEGYEDGAAVRTLLEWLVRAHRQESAAAIAFARLADELTSWAAPGALIAAARRGIAEEREHARLFAEQARGLAAACGLDVVLAPPSAGTFRDRSLLAMLLENVEEGCANETYAAMVATYQAELPARADLPAGLHDVFVQIAADERQHAALAFAIHAWGRTRLAPDERGVLDRTYARVVAAWQHVQRSEVGALLGEPPPAIAGPAFAAIAGELARAA